MRLDIKIPIGLMFSLFGLILTLFGLFTNGDDMYNKSIGQNINLYSGLFMLLFGGFMLLISDLTKKKKVEELKEIIEESVEEESEEESEKK